jgi:hypothetical protein
MGIAGGTPDTPAPYVVIANMVFESMESFEHSFGANAEDYGRSSKFTNVQPQVQISDFINRLVY